MHVCPISTQLRHQQKFSIYNPFVALQCKPISIFLCFLWTLLHYFWPYFSAAHCMPFVYRLSITFVNCLTHNNHWTFNPCVGVFRFLAKYFVTSVLYQVAVFQLVTLIMIVSLIKYLNVKKLFNKQMHLVVNLSDC